MPYLNVDDGFTEHPKVDALSDGAFRLHVSGMNYCARNLTDGHVPTHRVHRLMPVFKPKYLTELLDARVWLEAPDGGYLIHDYLQWNKPAEWWRTRRENEAKRQAEWRARHKPRNTPPDNPPNGDVTPLHTPRRQRTT